MSDSRPLEKRDTVRTTLIFAVGLALYLLLGLVLWWRLNVYVDPTSIEDPSKEATAKKDLIQAWGFIMAGVAGAVGIFFTWRNLQQGQASLRLTRETQEQNQQNTQAQLSNAQEELRLTRQGQMTERFTQAIEQLGSDKLEIKLGGIYSLERTAYEEMNYHMPVMEVLTSYVRRQAARRPEEESGENFATPEPDIQAILDVIGRRSKPHRINKEVEYGTIELNDTELRRAKLQGVFLQGADLRRADLQGALLQNANLRGANLQNANLELAALQGADLFRADLQGADLTEAFLQTALLIEANLFRATLPEASIEGTRLYGADLRGADLRIAKGMAHDQLEWTIGSNETRLQGLSGEDLDRPELWSKSFEEQLKEIRRVREDFVFDPKSDFPDVRSMEPT